MTNILISILCGFVGGLLGAMVIAETRDEDSKKQIQSLIDGHLSIKADMDKQKERVSLVAHATKVLALEQRKDRGQIWESLNALWNDYDERHAEKKIQKVEKTEKPKPKAKAKKEEKANA